MTPEQKIALLKDVARLAEPRGWGVCLDPEFGLNLTIGVDAGDLLVIDGAGVHRDDWNNSAAFALLKWLGVAYDIGINPDGVTWVCRTENDDPNSNGYLVYDDPEPIYAVLQAVRARLTNPERGESL